MKKKVKQIGPLLAAQIDAAMARAILAQSRAQSAMNEFHTLKEQIKTMCIRAGLDWKMIESGQIGIRTDGLVLTKDQIENLVKEKERTA